MNPEILKKHRDGTGVGLEVRCWQGLWGRLLALCLLLLLGTIDTFSQIVRRPTATQTIALRAGWNAIFIDVEPVERDPAKVFAGLPVAKVAAYLPSRTPVEFIQDPGSKDWKREGWSVWYGPGSAEEGLSDLYAVLGGRGYLVKMTEAAQLTVLGYAILTPFQWRADAYNLVGFPVDSVSPPTFAAWFAGSSSHQPTKRPTVYSLNEAGHWLPVDRMDQVQIRPSTAYWVFCQGGSSYQGPLSVQGTSGRLDFGDTSQSLRVRLLNPLPNPLSVTMEVVGVDNLPLVYEKPLLAIGKRLFLAFDGPVVLPSIEAGEELQIQLTLDRAQMAGSTGTAGTAVFILRDNVGSLLRIPVTGKLP